MAPGTYKTQRLRRPVGPEGAVAAIETASLILPSAGHRRQPNSPICGAELSDFDDNPVANPTPPPADAGALSGSRPHNNNAARPLFRARTRTGLRGYRRIP